MGSAPTGGNPITLRPEVQWFAEQLELELRKGDDDPDHTDWWLGHGDEVLLSRTRKALVQLDDSRYQVRTGADLWDSAKRLAIIANAVTAASFLLMLASNWRPFPRGEGKNNG